TSPAQPAMLLLLRGHVRLARREVREPGTNARGQLGVLRIGMTGLRGLDDLERAVDVLAIELETRGLDDGVDVVRVHRKHPSTRTTNPDGVRASPRGRRRGTTAAAARGSGSGTARTDHRECT